MKNPEGLNIDHCKGVKEGDGSHLIISALGNDPHHLGDVGSDCVVYSQSLTDPLQREFCGTRHFACHSPIVLMWCTSSACIAHPNPPVLPATKKIFIPCVTHVEPGPLTTEEAEQVQGRRRPRGGEKNNTQKRGGGGVAEAGKMIWRWCTNERTQN